MFIAAVLSTRNKEKFAYAFVSNDRADAIGRALDNLKERSDKYPHLRGTYRVLVGELTTEARPVLEYEEVPLTGGASYLAPHFPKSPVTDRNDED